jgi:hypothetical protein
MKYKVGDLVNTPDGRVPMLVTGINHYEKESTYTISGDMKQFITVDADWVEKNMVPCEY